MSSTSEKKGRGRPAKTIARKEDICEDYCFICKDGGHLRVCDFKQCIKTYHPHCVGKDESFLNSQNRWTCGLHSCFVCNKSSTYQCFGCTNAVCKRCIKCAEFVHVRGINGFCNNCLKLALLVEENVDVDSDGGKVDFKDRDTYEFLFKEYWEIINKKEGLTLEDLCSARIQLKKGESFKNGSDSDKSLGEEEDQDFDESMDSKVDINPDSLIGKDQKVFSPRKRAKNAKAKSPEFIGWGSKSLRDFLKSIGKDSDDLISQSEAYHIIIKYINEKKLFHPQKKKKVLCDTSLQSVFGRKSINRHKIDDLLERHFAANLEQSEEDDYGSDSDVNDNGTTVTCKRQRRTNSSRRIDEKDKVLEAPRSCFASVTGENIKLLYLKRSLIEEFLKNPDTSEDKLKGSFIRVKSDPNDIFQKNAYELLQVTGITKTQGTGNSNEEVTLNVSSVRKSVRICLLSEEDFSEEEIEDLRQKVKDGLLKKLKTVELEEKARSLHEDITKHWIKKELVCLQNLSDRANEKGWRALFCEYMDRIQLLETQSEQQRLIQQVPKVVAEEIEPEAAISPKGENTVEDKSPSLNLLPKDSLSVNDMAGIKYAITASAVIGDGLDRKDDENIAAGTGAIGMASKQDEIGNKYAITACVVTGDDLNIKDAENIGAGTGTIGLVSKQGKIGIEYAIIASAVTGDFDRQDSKYIVAGTGAIGLVSKQDEIGKHSPIQAIEEGGTERHIIDLDENEDDQGAVSLKDSNVELGTVSSRYANSELIDLDNDDYINPDSNVNPDIKMWLYMDPSGTTQGPFSMSQLETWWSRNYFHPDFKVWKEGQAKEEAILLEDVFHSMLPKHRQR